MFQQRRSLLGMVLMIGLASCADLRTRTSAGHSSESKRWGGRGVQDFGHCRQCLDGAPLGKARVSLVDTANPANAAWIITSENGRFSFESIPAGKYALEGERRGFLSANYEQHEQFSTAIVTGAGLKHRKPGSASHADGPAWRQSHRRIG